MAKKSFRQRVFTILNIPKSLPLLWRLLRDKRVPKGNKILFIGAVALYLFVPTDLFPDAIPFLGQFDDLTVLFFLWERFLASCPPNLLEEYER